VVSDRRIVIQKGQATVLDPDPIEDLGHPYTIPAALGGGVLFLGDRTLRFARAFDAGIVFIASSPKGTTTFNVGVGYGQVLVRSEPKPAVLHDLTTGKAATPPVTGASQLFGTPRGLVVLVTDKGELYASVKQGAGFKRLRSGVERLAYDGKGVVVYSKQRIERVDFEGRLSLRADEPGMTVGDNVDAFVDPWPDFSKPPPEPPDAERLLEPLVARMTEERAFEVREQDLLVLDTKSGKLIQEHKGYFAGHSNCFPIRGGTPSFVGCNGQLEMTLFRIESADAKPVAERTFKGVFTQDFGDPQADAPLALAKRCDGSPAAGAFCVRQNDGKWKELQKPADPHKLLAKVPFIVHVAAASDGSAYAFGWLDGNGDLVVVDARQKKVRRIQRSSIPRWAVEGIRWDALSLRGGVLRFLISADDKRTPGVLEIRADDSVDAKELPGRMASSGSRALLVTEKGTLEETLDAGVSFHAVASPPGGLPTSGLFRCVETGCTLGPWQRVGWGPD
jgi:hypothetical protein